VDIGLVVVVVVVLFCFFAFLWTEKKWRSTKTQKSERRISSRLGRISFVNKGFIIWPKREFFHAGSSREIPSLPSLVANQNGGFASSCPLVDLTI